MDLLYKPKHGFVREDVPRTNPGFFYVLFGIFFGAYILIKLFQIDTVELMNMTWSLFVAAGVLILIFSFLNLEMAVLSLVFIVPLTTFQLPGLPFHVTFGDAYLLVVTIAWLMRLMVKSGERIENTPIDKPLFLFVFLSATSVINAADMSAAATELVQTIEFFMATMYLFHAACGAPFVEQGRALPRAQGQCVGLFRGAQDVPHSRGQGGRIPGRREQAADARLDDFKRAA